MKSFREIASASSAYLVCICLLFLPILLGEKDFISHDNLTFFYPAFLKSHQFWDPNLGMGYPSYAEPQNFTFSWLVRLFPRSEWGFNLLVLSSIFASCIFTFLLCFEFTKDHLGSWVGGLVYGLGGSIIGQITMLPVSLSASVLPFVFYSFYKLGKQTNSPLYFFLSVLSIHLSFSLGWPLIIVHCGFLLAFIYLFLFLKKEKSSWTVLYSFAIAFLLGILLSAPILFSLIEILPFTPRSDKIDIHAFNAYKMDWEGLVRLFFPYLYGGVAQDGFISFTYIHPPTATQNFHETYRYMGLAPFFLSIFGFFQIEEKRLRNLFIFGILFYLFYSFGTGNPIGQFLFKIPVVNRLRGQARHFLEINLFISIAVAFGIVYLRSVEKPNLRLLGTIVSVFLIGIFLSLGNIFFNVNINLLYQNLTLLQFTGNNLLFFQWMILCFSIVTIIATIFDKKFLWVIPALVSVDLITNSRFQDWNSSSEKSSYTTINSPIPAGAKTDLYYPRSIQMESYYTNKSFPYFYLKNNYNSLLAISSVNFNGPLELNHVIQMNYIRALKPELNQIYGIEFTGGIYRGEYFSGFDRSLYIGSSEKLKGTLFPVKKSMEIDIPTNKNISTIHLYASVFYAEEKNTDQIGDIQLYGQNKSIDSTYLNPNNIASENFSCKAKKNVPEPYLTIQSLNNCLGIYKIDLFFSSNPLKLVLNVKDGFVVRVYAISYEIEGKINFIYPYPLTLKTQKEFYKDEKLVVYQNSSWPKTYFIDSVFASDPTTLREKMINFSTSDVKVFPNPMESAFVEIQNSPIPQEFQSLSGKLGIEPAKPKQIAEDRIILESNFMENRFLVLNQTYYPSWNAKINDVPTKIYKTNLAVSGIFVPAGKNQIEFYLEPKSVYYGIATSSLSLVGLLSYLFFARYKSLSEKRKTGYWSLMNLLKNTTSKTRSKKGEE